MDKHASYLDLKAPDHRRFGEMLGRVLAKDVQEDVARAKIEKDFSEQRKKALAYLPAARRWAPHLMEEFEGYAVGAGVTLEDVWLLTLEDEMEQLEHCTSVLTNEGRMLAHNEDWDVPGSEHRVYVLRRRIGREETLELYYRNTLGGNAIGIGPHGMMYAVNTIDCADARVGVPRNFLARAAADARSLKEAIELLTTARRASGHAYLFMHGADYASVEVTATKLAAKHHPSLPFCHTNHILDPHLAASRQTFGHYHGSEGRLRVARELVKPHMKPEALEKALEDTSHGPEKSLLNQDTVGRVLIDFDRKTFNVWLKREPEKGWVDYPFTATR